MCSCWLCKCDGNASTKCCTSADLSSAVNLSQLNNYNTFNSHVNLNRNRINKLLPGRLLTDAVTVKQVHKLIGLKYVR